MTFTQSAGDLLEEFRAGLDFALDPFQRRACEELAEGRGVLVCAPTGAGKTVVGEFAVHLALRSGSKCFYTTPIKALSNQKYADLVARHGEDVVGLLTGDQSIRSEAPVVVMTTEVLRNMLYAQSATLTGLSHVVMDEVHFLADRFRGAVWEEVILHLPPAIRLVSLSATVSNAEEFGAWMRDVRGDTTVIVDEHRPVPLTQHMLVGRRLFDLFEPHASGGRAENARVNPQLKQHLRRQDVDTREWPGPGGRGRRGRPPAAGRYRPPSRPHMLADLDRAGLLPAIVFIFSRAGCEGALHQCLRSGLDLTTDEQRKEIREIVHRHTADLPHADLEVLDFWRWRESLEHGIAAHHAGMLPVFRHTVEELFVRGLVRAVFATETLALGINMPARSVVLERLLKYNGETHAELTPGEYTQLTGRAGRRGIDVEGHAVVVWQPGVDPSSVAGLASTRTYPLKSSFLPAYNMAVNLVRQFGRRAARELLEQSFAQFQADRSVVGVSRTIARNQEALQGYRERMACDQGDFAEYEALRAGVGKRERELQRQTRAGRRRDAVDSLHALRRGDVIGIPAGRRAGLAVVLETAADAADPRPLVLTEDRWAGRVTAADFPAPAERLGTFELPRRVDHRVARVRRDLSSRLRDSGITAPRRPKKSRRSAAADDRELASLRRRLRDHPCHGCPDREQHARWAKRHAELLRETRALEQRRSATTHYLARTFDRIVRVLVELGYLPPDDEQGTDDERLTGPEQLTGAGSLLADLYCERDLLVAECLRRGVWRGLPPPTLAAVVSLAVYESRSVAGGRRTQVTGDLRRGIADTMQVWDEVAALEARHKLPQTREPDAGFATAVEEWALDRPLVEVLATAGEGGDLLSAGDFVRWCRQVIDLLDQVHSSAPDRELRSAAGKAIVALRRGVVAIDPV